MAAKYRLRLDLSCAKSAVKCLRLSDHMCRMMHPRTMDYSSFDCSTNIKTVTSTYQLH